MIHSSIFPGLQIIEGILDVESGAVLTVCGAVQNGLLDDNTALSLLAAQLMTTGLLSPEQHLCMDLDEAFKSRLVDKSMFKQLQNLNEAKKRLQDPQYALEPLPVITALKNGDVSEQTALKILEIQLATGSLRRTNTGDIFNLERAFQLDLVPHSLFFKILERRNTCQDLIDPNTAEKVSLSDLLQRSVIHEPGRLRLLPVKIRNDGTIPLTHGEDISVMRAAHEGIIDRETMLRLLSTQLFAGGIVDPSISQKQTVEEAVNRGMIDQDTASEILSHQAQTGGIVKPCTGDRLTVDEAVQCELISSSSALLVLERQKAFMGLLWPHTGEILSFSTSLQQKIVTDQLATELLNKRKMITALYIPENSEVVDIDSAVQYNLIDTFTKDLLKTLEIPDVFPDIDELNDRFSSWLVRRELQVKEFQGSNEEIKSDGCVTNAPSTTEAKQLFLSYLMMNSYMDPMSGQRLLVFDRQVDKMAKLLFVETAEAECAAKIISAVDDSEESLMNMNISDFVDKSLVGNVGALEELQICESSERKTEDELEAEDAKALPNNFEFTLNSEPDVNILEIEETFDAFLSSGQQMTTVETQKPDKDSTCLHTDNCQSDRTDMGSLHLSQALQLRQTTFIASETPISLYSVVDHFICDDTTEKDQERHSSSLPYLMSIETSSNVEMTSEFPHSRVLCDSKLERDFAIHLLRAQVEEGGILDVTTGKRYELDAALNKGLIDEDTVLEVLAVQLQEGSFKENESVTMSILKRSVSKGYISNKVALHIMEKQNMLGGFYTGAVEKNISVCEILETGLITGDSSRSVPSSEPTSKAIIDQEVKCLRSVSDAHQMEMLEDEEVKKLLHSQQDRSVDVMVLDFVPDPLYSKLDEATQVTSDIAHLSKCQDPLVPTIAVHDSPSDDVPVIYKNGSNNNEIDKVAESNGIGVDNVNCNHFKKPTTVLETLDEEGRFTEEQDEAKSLSKKDETFVCHEAECFVSDLCEAGYIETTASQVHSPVQTNSGISCSSQSDICSNKRQAESKVYSEQETNSFENESEISHFPSKGISSKSFSTLQPEVIYVAPLETLAQTSCESRAKSPAEMNLSSNDQLTLAQGLQPQTEDISPQSKVFCKAVDEETDKEQFDETSKCSKEPKENKGVLEPVDKSLEKLVKVPMTKNNHTHKSRVVLIEGSTDSENTQNNDLEGSIGFEGSEQAIEVNSKDAAESTVISKSLESPLPLEMPAEASQGDSNNGINKIDHLSEHEILCNRVALKTEIDDVVTVDASDFEIDNEQDLVQTVESVSTSASCSDHVFTEFKEMQSTTKLPSSSVTEMLKLDTKRSTDVYKNLQSGDELVTGDVHQDIYFPLPQQELKESEIVPQLVDSSYFKIFLSELLQMNAEGLSADEMQKRKCQVIDNIIEIIQRHPTPFNANQPNFTERSVDPDILLDLKKHGLDLGEEQKCAAEPHHQSGVGFLQSQLQEMIQGISIRRDQGMLKDWIKKLSTGLKDNNIDVNSTEVEVKDDGIAFDVCQATTSNHQESKAVDQNSKQTDGINIKPAVSS